MVNSLHLLRFVPFRNSTSHPLKFTLFLQLPEKDFTDDLHNAG
jgi:hypothetical protein